MIEQPATKPRTLSEIFPTLSEDFRRRVVKRALKHRPESKALRRQRGAALRRLRVGGYRRIPGESLERLDALNDPVESDLLPDTVQKMFTDGGTDAAAFEGEASPGLVGASSGSLRLEASQASLSGSRLVPMWAAPATRNSPPRTIRAVPSATPLFHGLL